MESTMIQQQTWNCEHCGARGCVEMESAADVCTVIDLIRDDACLPDELRPAPAPPASPDARRLAAAGAAVELFQCGWLLMRGGAESIDAVIALIERHNARHFPAAIDYAAAREKVANVLRGYRPGPPHEVEDFYWEAAALLRKIGVKP
jgi:hypothetical protein